MKTVYELTPAQLSELKLAYVVERADREGKEVSWADLAAADTIPDSVIHDYYEGVSFSDDDFSCTAEV